jgi:hypothetical protein
MKNVKVSIPFHIFRYLNRYVNHHLQILALFRSPKTSASPSALKTTANGRPVNYFQAIQIERTSSSKVSAHPKRSQVSSPFFLSVSSIEKVQLFSLLNFEQSQSRSQADISVLSSYILFQYLHSLKFITFETISELPFCFHLKIKKNHKIQQNSTK